MEQVLKLSDLRFLSVECGAFDPSPASHLGQVLDAVQLIAVGSDGQEQRLSHTSAVWLHDVIYLFSPEEVLVKNMAMQEAGDWELVRGALDDPLSETIALINCNNAQNA
ncbi:MAG: hypothetical protein BYD32DRAFT_462669 [Podila humilis]|nr:MAG: hypothetical protein BYD32DRAFT_462669 [Podila humilis]